jgi:hypothetical protein
LKGRGIETKDAKMPQAADIVRRTVSHLFRVLFSQNIGNEVGMSRQYTSRTRWALQLTRL